MSLAGSLIRKASLVGAQRPRLALTLIITLGGLVSCGGSSSSSKSPVVDETPADARNGEQLSLIDVAAWEPLDAQDDVLGDHRPETVNCPDNAWYIEEGALEVETGFCNYLALTQASPASIHPGDELHIVLWHADLRFEKTTQAHVALLAGENTLWEQWVTIPAEANVYDETVVADFYLEAGEALVFHLHNHGFNTWNLLTLELLPQ